MCIPVQPGSSVRWKVTIWQAEHDAPPKNNKTRTWRRSRCQNPPAAEHVTLACGWAEWYDVWMLLHVKSVLKATGPNRVYVTNAPVLNPAHSFTCRRDLTDNTTVIPDLVSNWLRLTSIIYLLGWFLRRSRCRSSKETDFWLQITKTRSCCDMLGLNWGNKWSNTLK